MNTIYCTIAKDATLIQLPLVIDLKDKSIGLVDISGYYFPRKAGDKSLYLVCDVLKNNGIISRTSTSNVYPILRQLLFKSAKTDRHPNYAHVDKEKKTYQFDRIKETYQKVLFIPCQEQKTDTLQLYLINSKGERPSFDDWELKCTLLIA